MSADAAYLDTSAFLKTVSTELESPMVTRYLEKWPRLVSSKLLPVEMLRAALRRGPEVVLQARAELQRVRLIDLNDAILELAATLQPASPRSLDAIHLATAQALGSDLGVIVTYDQRLAAAARALGLPVEAPV